MHQSGRLERLARRFIRHLCGGKLAQFVVNEWQELLRCNAITAHRSVQDARKIGHGTRVTGSIRKREMKVFRHPNYLPKPAKTGLVSSPDPDALSCISP